MMAYELRHKPKDVCFTVIKVAIIQVVTTANYYAENELNKVYLDEEIVRITHQWNVSLED